MTDKLELGNLTANMKVIDAIRKKWDVPPDAGDEIDWWCSVGGVYCALCEHMAVVNGGEVWNIWVCSKPYECPLNDTNYTCSKEFEALCNYFGRTVDREHFLQLFTAMRDRVFSLRAEDIPGIVDSDNEKEDE